jgi:hypothetical protein
MKPDRTWDALVVPYLWSPNALLRDPHPRNNDARLQHRISEIAALRVESSTEESTAPYRILSVCEARSREWKKYASRLRNCDDYYRTMHALPGGGAQWAVAMLVMRPLVAAVYLTLRRLRRTTVCHLSRCLEQRCCPRCSYRLIEVDRIAEPSHPLRGIAVERCPECGYEWPLLPPPEAELSGHVRKP